MNFVISVSFSVLYPHRQTRKVTHAEHQFEVGDGLHHTYRVTLIDTTVVEAAKRAQADCTAMAKQYRDAQDFHCDFELVQVISLRHYKEHYHNGKRVVDKPHPVAA